MSKIERESLPNSLMHIFFIIFHVCIIPLFSFKKMGPLFSFKKILKIMCLSYIVTFVASGYVCVHPCAVLCLVAQLYPTLCNIPARLLCPWGFSKQEYWSGLPCPPPGDRPSPQIEPRLHWRQILYRLSHQGSPCMLEWVAYPFVRGSSQGIFPTQESNRLLHRRRILLPAEPPGKPHVHV